MECSDASAWIVPSRHSAHRRSWCHVFGPFVAAVLSGGVFGDHCSPISDTTIISSLASASDHIEHVRTQIPYALVAGAVAAVGFAITGLVLGA